MTQKTLNACIVIPVYKKILDRYESLSLEQGFNIFKNHQIIFICPESFEESWVTPYNRNNKKIIFEKFPNQFFVSAKSYSSLLLQPEFYKRFKDYNFMLIYQTDAYVFSDQLEYWCNQNLDYIGAPWFKNFDEYGKEKELMPQAGNGGFSLRNVSNINLIMQKRLGLLKVLKLIKILRKERYRPNNKMIFWIRFSIKFFRKENSFGEICNYLFRNTPCTNEDYFFAYIYPLLFPEFKVAKSSNAIAFAFECHPEILYEINQEQLPFGCHGWQKYSPNFWKKYIPFT